MKVLFCSVPGYGHVLPLVPLAEACIEQGYDTTFASGPTMVGRLPVTSTIGLPDWTLGDVEAETKRRHPELAELPLDEGYRFAVELFADVTAEGFINTLGPLLEELAPDLVVYEVTSVGAALAAARREIPFACVGIVQRSFFTQLLHLTAVERHGLEASGPLVPRAYLDLFPPSMRSEAAVEHPASASLRPVPVSTVDASVPEWLLQRGERKRVYVTLGTVAFGAIEAFESVLDALDHHDIDVLVTVGPDGDPSTLRPRAGRIHIERFVNQAGALAHVDAVIHHGGSGTMLAAMAMGLPQVVVPQGADQFQNAATLQSTDAGRSVFPGASASELTEAIEDALSNPTITEAANGMATEIRSMPAPATVAEGLRALI